MSAGRLDWSALGSYTRAVGAASRGVRDGPAPAGSLPVTIRQVGWYRAAASHLATRLPARPSAAATAAGDVTAGDVAAGGVAAGGVAAGGVAAGGVAARGAAAGSVAAGGVAAGDVTAGSVAARGVAAGGAADGGVAAAAYGGLQDSWPRAGLLGLHARLAGVRAGDWEHPALAQVWLRRADYVVPRRDAGVFTVGALPRDAAQAAALRELAERVLRICAGRPRPTREVADALGPRGADVIRLVGVSGRLLLRWDASRIDLVPVAAPDVEPEAARQELARRYLHWHGPASHRQFARWAGVGLPDATATWAVLGPELIAVDLDGRARWLLAADEQALRTAERPTGVRLLPPGDPYLQADLALLVEASPTGEHEPTIATRATDSRLRNSLTGRILVDGDLAGAWARRGATLTLAAWRPAGAATARIESEAALLAAPLDQPPHLTWLP